MKENNYYLITIKFYPDYEKNILKKIDDNTYKYLKTGDIYKKRLMYDWGWGQEYGYERLPKLSFLENIKIVENYKGKIFNYSRNHMNFIGAISIIIQDYVEELIIFLEEKIKTDYFFNKRIKQNFQWFSLSAEKTREKGRIPGGIMYQSYEEILNQYPKWLSISNEVITTIYS